MQRHRSTGVGYCWLRHLVALEISRWVDDMCSRHPFAVISLRARDLGVLHLQIQNEREEALLTVVFFQGRMIDALPSILWEKKATR